MIDTKLLRKLRKDLGLTQNELALKVGVGQSYINKIERGFTDPSLPTLKRMGKVLGIDYKELLK